MPAGLSLTALGGAESHALANGEYSQLSFLALTTAPTAPYFRLAGSLTMGHEALRLLCSLCRL